MVSHSLLQTGLHVFLEIHLFNHFAKFFDSHWILIQHFKRLLTPLSLILWKT